MGCTKPTDVAIIGTSHTAFPSMSKTLRFWVVDSDLFGDRGLQGFDTKLEAECLMANLEHQHPMRSYKIQRLAA